EEADRAGAFALRADAGGPVSLEPASIADGCNAPRLGQLPFELCRHLEHQLVTADQIEDAFRSVYPSTKIASAPSGSVHTPRRRAAEPAAAVAAAARLHGKIEADNPVLVVSGGNADPKI